MQSQAVIFLLRLSCVILICSLNQKWFTCNFSLQYPSTIQQIGNESIQMYQVKFVILIQHQILATNLQGNMLQLEERIENQI